MIALHYFVAARAARRGSGLSAMEEEPVTMEMVPVEEGVVTEQPGSSEGSDRGSIVYLGRSKEKHTDRAILNNITLDARYNRIWRKDVRHAIAKMVEDLVQKGASSGILALGDGNTSWSASPEDVKYQRHDSQGEGGQGDQHAKTRLFADFEGAIHDKGDSDAIAMYRVTLPRGGLDPDKWAGRPPLAPAELYTGPRSDGLLSTDEISGEYCVPGYLAGHGLNCCSIGCCMIAVPLGPDAIETSTCGCCCFPPLLICSPMCGYDLFQAVQTREPGTNEFGPGSRGTGRMTFSADGRISGAPFSKADGYKRRKAYWGDSRKVATKDLAGSWFGCEPFALLIPFCTLCLSPCSCTTKKAINEDQYVESGCFCSPQGAACLPCAYGPVRYTRRYVNGLPTNRFDTNSGHWDLSKPEKRGSAMQWHYGPSCEAHQVGYDERWFLATKCPC